MPGKYLTTASTIQCPHEGTVTLITTNTKVMAGGAPVLLESDIHVVAGCPFVIGIVPSPCVTVEWSAGSTKTTINGTAPLVESSLGTCYGPTNAPQGVTLIVNKQLKAEAQ